MRHPSLLATIYADQPHLIDEVRALIAIGADPDGIAEEMAPLLAASSIGRFDVVALLLDAGANWYQLGWTESIQQTVFGTPGSLRASVLAHDDLERTEYFGRTPLLIAILIGDTAKAALLLEMGANRAAVGRCGQTAAAHAIPRNGVAMLHWLVDQNFDLEARDDFGCTPLMEAAQSGKVDSVRFLASHGVDLYKTSNTNTRALQMASDIDVVRVLVDHGDELSGLAEEAHASLVGVECDGYPAVDVAAFQRHAQRVFGNANPQRTDHPFWLDMVRCGASAWRARESIGGDADIKPVWCYKRFGRSTTLLPDGRIVEIGGEHEDDYDTDFCIYNDVTVFDGQGGIAIYSYPSACFPPTDSHTATLVDNVIYIIGSLGYRDARQPGVTPAFMLDLASFAITEVKTQGACPGWIYSHKARIDGANGIVVSDGLVEAAMRGTGCEVANTRRYRLCLDTHIWSRLAD